MRQEGFPQTAQTPGALFLIFSIPFPRSMNFEGSPQSLVSADCSCSVVTELEVATEVPTELFPHLILLAIKIQKVTFSQLAVAHLQGACDPSDHSTAVA